MKTKILFLGLFLVALSFSCTKKEENPATPTNADSAIANQKMNSSNDDVSKIVEDLSSNASWGSTAGRSVSTANSFLPICAVVTTVPNTAPVAGTTYVRTVDFGTSGCALPNGNILKGKIVITFTYEPTATTHSIDYSFVNFYHNAIKYNGDKNFTWQMMATPANSVIHPYFTMVMDMDATFPDGSIYHRVGTRYSEITAGGSTPAIWNDNEYQVKGQWTTTFPDGTDQSSTISNSNPLVIRMLCFSQGSAAISKGLITFVKDGVSSTLDYGNGICDRKAIYTIYGLAFEIDIW